MYPTKLTFIPNQPFDDMVFMNVCSITFCPLQNYCVDYFFRGVYNISKFLPSLTASSFALRNLKDSYFFSGMNEHEQRSYKVIF